MFTGPVSCLCWHNETVSIEHQKPHTLKQLGFIWRWVALCLRERQQTLCAAVYIQLWLAASIRSLESHRHIWRREVSGITLLWFTTLVTVKRSNVNNIALASSDMPTQFMGMLKDWMAWRILFCEFVFVICLLHIGILLWIGIHFLLIAKLLIQ